MRILPTCIRLWHPAVVAAAAGLGTTAVPAAGELQITGIETTPDRQVELVLDGVPEASVLRVQFLAAEDGGGPRWVEDARAIVVPGGGGGSAFVRTRLPGSVSSRFLRVAAAGGDPARPLRLSEIVSDNADGPRAGDGSTPDWIEVENTSDQPVALGGYALGDDPDDFFRMPLPDQLLAPGGRLLVLLDGFGVDESGESVYLVSPDGWLADSVRVPALREDESLARRGEAWFVMEEGDVTPGAPNAGGGTRYTQPPRISLGAGVYDSPVTVHLAPAGPGDTVHFSVDGSEPDLASPVYEPGSPLEIAAPLALRARSFGPDGTGSPVRTRTYLVGVDHALPVVAMAAAPENFEFHRGYLYGMGSVLNSSGDFITSNRYPYSASNAWRDREVETNIELFEPDGSRAFNVVAGLKVFGGWGSRGYPQKSFAVFARRRYGFGKIRYQIFPDRDVHDFETFVLRNSGNDNQSTHHTYPRSEITAFGPPRSWGSYFANGNFTLFRDAALTSLGGDIGLDVQAYRPAVLYLNGQYWGIYNLREKLNEHYVESHFGVPDDEVDLIEGYGSANSGTATAYTRMRTLVDRMDTEAEYRAIEAEHLDIANFIDYHLSVIFFQNFDIGNIKCWRPRTPGADGRFRWLLYDQDYGFDLWPPDVYGPAMRRDFADYHNTFDFYTNDRGSGWPNGADRTLLLRRMLAIDEFRGRFIRRCADLLNSTFREENVAARIEALAAVIRAEIPAHLERWSWPTLEALGFGEPHKPADTPLDALRWEQNVAAMVAFAHARPAELRQHLIDHFDLDGGLAQLQILPASPPDGGAVELSTLTVSPHAEPWSGTQFVDFPPPLRAVPNPGFRFAGWDGDVSEPASAATAPALSSGGAATVKAVFEPDD